MHQHSPKFLGDTYRLVFCKIYRNHPIQIAPLWSRRQATQHLEVVSVHLEEEVVVGRVEVVMGRVEHQKTGGGGGGAGGAVAANWAFNPSICACNALFLAAFPCAFTSSALSLAISASLATVSPAKSC